jgi:hypothetical protein
MRKDSRPTLLCRCARCERPVGIIIANLGSGGSYAAGWFETSHAKANVDLLETTGWEIYKMYPTPEASVAPEHTPPDIARIYIQGMDNRKRENLDSAAIMFRKTLEVATKRLDPGLNVPLQRRIDALAAADRIPKEVGQWAHEIRIVGNDAAHDVDEPKPSDVDAIAEFTEAFLEYVFTLPRKFELRKSQVTKNN